ncbi:MAG: branched-chain amino acid ABC transporter permease [Planctomycetes bacterium]|nr:branched-chain amino acid ABC transporter permease [Planctomycetota bacterium]
MFQHIVDGTTQGAIYALIALGYTLVYGILGMINFAHGEVYMIGAYIGIISLAVFTATGMTLISLPLCVFVAFLAALFFCAAYGYTIEKTAYRPLRQAHILAPLISAIGMSTFLQNYVMLAHGKDKFDFPGIFRAAFINNTVQISGARVNYLEIFIIAASLVTMLCLHLMIRYTRIGKAMRATAQDKKMAGLVGININRVIPFTFIVGSALAAIAGVMVSMYVGATKFDDGYMAGMKAFTAAVLGGIGNITGTMLGGFILGLAESMGIWLISSDYKDAYSFILLLIVLIVRPRGLLGEQVSDRA